MGNTVFLCFTFAFCAQVSCGKYGQGNNSIIILFTLLRLTVFQLGILMLVTVVCLVSLDAYDFGKHRNTGNQNIHLP